MSTFGEEIGAKGWCTGRVIPHDAVSSLLNHLQRPGQSPADVAADDWLVVISQTCDIVAAKQEAEPLVEVLHCRPIKKTRSQFRDLHSTRRLDFLANRQTHPGLALTAHATIDRYVIPRDLLRGIVPDVERYLDSNAWRRLLSWYSLRASRPAWPDVFNNRIRPVSQELEAAIAPLRDEIAEVRIGITPREEELPTDQPYIVTVFFVVDHEIWRTEPDTVRQVQQAFQTFIALLGKCDGIEVDGDSCAEDGGEFTWQETRSTDEWNFANLSHQE